MIFCHLTANDAEAPPDEEKDQDVNGVAEKLEGQTLDDKEQVEGASRFHHLPSAWCNSASGRPWHLRVKVLTILQTGMK